MITQFAAALVAAFWVGMGLGWEANQLGLVNVQVPQMTAEQQEDADSERVVNEILKRAGQGPLSKPK
jgi:hypothetical protein